MNIIRDKLRVHAPHPQDLKTWYVWYDSGESWLDGAEPTPDVVVEDDRGYFMVSSIAAEELACNGKPLPDKFNLILRRESGPSSSPYYEVPMTASRKFIAEIARVVSLKYLQEGIDDV